jgi:hypothetical protein
MSKIHVLCALSLALVVTRANAPTFRLWPDLPTADLVGDDAADIRTASDYDNPYLSFNTLEQEFSEDDALDRFEIDEWFLPRLNVDLPELFDWSNGDNAYYARSLPPSQMSYGLDTAAGVSFRTASFGHELAGGRSGGGDGGGSASIAAANRGDADASQSNGKGSSSTSESGPKNDVSTETPAGPDDVVTTDADEAEQLAKNDEPTNPVYQDVANELLPPLAQAPIIETPIVSNEPVQVPTPGVFGLFVLGLAGMRLAGRKKNRSG